MKRVGRRERQVAKAHRWLAVTALLLGVAGASQAQVYRCPSGNGYVYSDRPCGGNLGVMGGDSTRPSTGSSTGSSSSSYSPSRYDRSTGIDPAPEHYAFLSPTCQQLNDALRTARTRGLKFNTIAELRDEWERRCSDDEMDARKRLRDKKRDDKTQRDTQRASVEQEKARGQMEQQQCAELLRILTAKRRRTDLGPGEQADLQRSEASYQARCTSR